MMPENALEKNFLPYAVFINFRVSSTSKDIISFINTLSLATSKYKNLISLDGVSVGPDNSNFVFKIKVPVDNTLKEAENSLRCAHSIFNKLFSFYPSYAEEPSLLHKDQAKQFIENFMNVANASAESPAKTVATSHLLVAH